MNECNRRLQKELKKLVQDPIPGITARPSPNNLLDWHYVIEFNPATPDSPFAGGVYWGRLTFSPDYPFKPPSLQITTPNGRFAVNTKLCTSFSDFHPESWHPGWSISTILVGFQSFMNDIGASTTGAISTSAAEKKQLAADSLAYNMRLPLFTKVFPEWIEKAEKWKIDVAKQPVQGDRRSSDKDADGKVEQQLAGAGGDAAPQHPFLGLRRWYAPAAIVAAVAAALAIGMAAGSDSFAGGAW